MKDKLHLGTTPAEEECAQVGSPGYRDRARLECSQWITALTQHFGEPPDGAKFKIVSESHDFGSTLEVAIEFDSDNEKAVEFAFRVEESAPTSWADYGMKAPRMDDPEFTKDELMPVPEGGRKYIGAPKNCDICGGSVGNEFSDAATHFGRWANMCAPCATKNARGYGTGVGQRYKKAVDGNFYKIEG